MRTDDWPERQRKAAKKRRREDRITNVIAGAVVGTGGAVLVVLLLLLGALSVWVGWNLGVTGLAKAVHAHVSNISIWTALGTSFLIGVLGRIFRDDMKINLKKTKA